MQRHTSWIIYTCIGFLVGCVMFAAITIYIDPFFHYHKPLDNYAYPLTNERYQNDGITRHFEYDSIITGTSLTENFMTTQADALFDANFIKVPFYGASYKEINDNLKRAFDTGKKIKYVIRCLDNSRLVMDKDAMKEDYDIPVYLYNSNPFDDVNYVLNKTIFAEYTLNVIAYTKAGNETTPFDVYANWNANCSYGPQAVFSNYELGDRVDVIQELTDAEVQTIQENIKYNVTDLVSEHPETQFYIFFSPYSICYWDQLDNNGQINWRIEAEKIAIEALLEYPNIKLYSFSNNFELTCNLDNYRDANHYGEWINSYILQCMKEDQYLLTKDNYNEYIEMIRDFYGTYDYTSLHKQK